MSPRLRSKRAKAQLKASVLLSLDGTTAVAEDIGRQLVTTGRRMEPNEIERRIDAIHREGGHGLCQSEALGQGHCISAVGSIEALFDYQRLRNTMKPKFLEEIR